MRERIAPSPAMVIAMVALLAALGGTAVGAKVLGKKQVKKISRAQANKVFDQRKGEVTTALGKLTRVEGPEVSIPAGDVGTATATCPAGQAVVSGGYSFIAADGEVFFGDSFVTGGTSWNVGGDNHDSLISGELTAIAFCAPSGQAVSASSAATARDRAEAAVERQRAVHGL